MKRLFYAFGFGLLAAAGTTIYMKLRGSGSIAATSTAPGIAAPTSAAAATVTAAATATTATAATPPDAGPPADKFAMVPPAPKFGTGKFASMVRKAGIANPVVKNITSDRTAGVVVSPGQKVAAGLTFPDGVYTPEEIAAERTVIAALYDARDFTEIESHAWSLFASGTVYTPLASQMRGLAFELHFPNVATLPDDKRVPVYQLLDDLSMCQETMGDKTDIENQGFTSTVHVAEWESARRRSVDADNLYVGYKCSSPEAVAAFDAAMTSGLDIVADLAATSAALTKQAAALRLAKANSQADATDVTAAQFLGARQEVIDFVISRWANNSIQFHTTGNTWRSL